jgi:hypothetical protein
MKMKMKIKLQLSRIAVVFLLVDEKKGRAVTWIH